MATYVLPVLFAVLVWWLSTGLVLLVVSRPPATHRLAITLATALLAAGFVGLAWSADRTSLTAAYVAFASAIAVWAWHEMSFLTGFVTGPVTTAAPPRPADARAPLARAAGTLIYHELAVVLTLVAIALVVGDGANTVGLWTFAVLWALRLSAKLNVYLGVPNWSEEFLPAHLVYLKSYFCRRPMNLLFPITVTAATAATVLLVEAAFAPSATAFQVAGLMLVATFLALAVIEHWFLVVPLQSAQLWSWGLDPNRQNAASDPQSATERAGACPVTVTS